MHFITPSAYSGFTSLVPMPETFTAASLAISQRYAPLVPYRPCPQHTAACNMLPILLHKCFLYKIGTIYYSGT